MKNKLKEIKGITLIALVITIIVLLILAGVSIATLTGENGILTQASNAKGKTAKAEAEEIFNLIESEWQIEKRKTGANFDNFLASKETEYGIEKTKEADGENYVLKYNGYQTTIDSKGKLVGEISKVEQKPTIPNVTFDPNTLEIGEAINSQNYGKKVTNYTVKEEETGGWRLFYQDNNYTYLISDNCIGSYTPGDYFSSYPNGSYVSTVGQRLNKMLLDDGNFFVSDNENDNIKAIAWFTDTEADIWKQYKNNDAVFAIASPTVELFKSSFNATASANNTTPFSLGIGEDYRYGYFEDLQEFQLKASYNNEIYFKSTGNYWWIASPNERNRR